MKTREQARKASGLRQFINNSGTSFSLLIALLIACVVYTIVSPKHVFFTARNFSNILCRNTRFSDKITLVKKQNNRFAFTIVKYHSKI